MYNSERNEAPAPNRELNVWDEVADWCIEREIDMAKVE